MSIDTKITNGDKNGNKASLEGNDDRDAGRGKIRDFRPEGELCQAHRLPIEEAGLRLRHHPQGRHHGSHMHKETEARIAMISEEQQ